MVKGEAFLCIRRFMQTHICMFHCAIESDLHDKIYTKEYEFSLSKSKTDMLCFMANKSYYDQVHLDFDRLNTDLAGHHKYYPNACHKWPMWLPYT